MYSGILASAVLSISLLSGGVAFAGQVIDHAMGTTEVPDAPLRVITLTNETTEAALALGMTPVGAPKSWYGDPWYPHLGDRLEGTEVLGTELAVNVELVAALEPDLIIGSRKRDEEIYGQLSAIAPTVFIEGLGAWKDNFAFVADVLNREAEGEAALDLRILVDRSVVEVFVQGGRAVFSKTFAPSVLYVPDTAIAVHAFGAAPLTLESVAVYSMGCGWTDPPWQPHPQL